ncbi:MAG: RNA polymerase sigma factor [Acidimicrobiales bacterium]
MTDESALERFRALYRESLPHVYGYLLRRVGWDVSTAEELTQETYLALVRRLGGPDPGPDLNLPWLIGVARHKLVDHLRRAGREQRRLSAVRDQVGAEGAGPSEASDRALVTLAELPGPQGAALALRYLDDLPVVEVAQVLGRSVRATESLLARGRAAFRCRYQEGFLA